MRKHTFFLSWLLIALSLPLWAQTAAPKREFRGAWLHAVSGEYMNDTYDFNVGQGNYAGNTSQYSNIRRFGGKHGSKSTDPDHGKIKFNINVKR